MIPGKPLPDDPDFHFIRSWACCGLLILLGIIQLAFFSMDPLDSNFIAYEQSVYLSAAYGLPHVNEVLLRSDLDQIIDYRFK